MPLNQPKTPITKDERRLLDQLATEADPVSSHTRLQSHKHNINTTTHTDKTTPKSTTNTNIGLNTASGIKKEAAIMGEEGKPVLQRLAVVNATEISKFKGNRRECDVIFTPGPSIEEFVQTINTYCSTHNISDDEGKLNILRLNTSQSQGDGWSTINRYSDNNLTTTFSYNEICTRLKRIYQSLSRSNFASAANRYNNANLKPAEVLDLGEIQEVENSAINVVDQYLNRTKYLATADNRPIREIMAELLISIQIANKLGSKVADAVITNHGPNEPLIAICENTVEYVKKNPNSVTRNEEVKWTQNKKSTPNTFKIICPRCGIEGHRFKQCKVDSKKIFCGKCEYKNDHVTSQCDRARKFRERKASNQPRGRTVNKVNYIEENKVSDSES